MVYLDHAAATPLNPKALKAMLPYYTEQFFNPSAAYLSAKHVREAYEAAKNTIAHTIGAKGTDLVITSGATESISLAFTALRAFPDTKALILATEHPAVLSAAASYRFDTIPVDQAGLIQLDILRERLSDEVSFVSVSLANNELGTIQPLAEIAEIIRDVRKSRLQRGINLPIYLHSDASQALTLIDVNVARLGVDLLTINAAKCGGPKGVGALYLAHDVKLSPFIPGGGQERGLRGGTENVPGVISFAVAATETKKHLTSHRKACQEMAQILRKGLSHTSIISHIDEKIKHDTNQSSQKPPFPPNTPAILPPELPQSIPEPLFLGNPKHQLASFVPVCFPGIDAERLIYKLEQSDILVSTGAACAANKGTKSHVLEAIGLSDSEIAGSLRLTLGPANTLEQIKEATKIIREEVCHEYMRLGFGAIFPATSYK